jgi:hypothetical protein
MPDQHGRSATDSGITYLSSAAGGEPDRESANAVRLFLRSNARKRGANRPSAAARSYTHCSGSATTPPSATTNRSTIPSTNPRTRRTAAAVNHVSARSRSGGTTCAPADTGDQPTCCTRSGRAANSGVREAHPTSRREAEVLRIRTAMNPVVRASTTSTRRSTTTPECG